MIDPTLFALFIHSVINQMSSPFFCPFVWFHDILVNVQHIVGVDVQRKGGECWMLQATTIDSSRTIQWEIPSLADRSDDEEQEMGNQLFNEFAGVIRDCYANNAASIERLASYQLNAKK